MTAIVLRGDARALPLPDASVDLIVTSPPYFGLRDYGFPGQIGSEATPQEWVAALVACTAEWMRVLKPSGSMFVNCGDKYAGGGQGGNVGGNLGVSKGGNPYLNRTPKTKAARSTPPGARDKSLLGLPWRYALACTGGGSQFANPRLVKALMRDYAEGRMTLTEAEAMIDYLATTPDAGLGLILRRDIIWAKPNSLPESVVDRCRSSHEYVFHLVKQGRYYAAVDEIREAYSDAPDAVHHRRKGIAQNTRHANEATNSTRRDYALTGVRPAYENPLGKLPGSVWSIPSQPLQVPAHLGVDHFAAFPMELPRRCILGWSPPGICVACGEGRRPVRGVDWSKVPHRMGWQRSTKPTPEQAFRWCSAFADWCEAQGLTRDDLDTATGTSDMGGWWMSRLPHRCAVPAPPQWQKIRDRWPTIPPQLDALVGDMALLPVAEIEDGSGNLLTGRHNRRAKSMTFGEYGTITGYACACPTPDAPTRPAIVVDPFGGTGTTALVAAMLGRVGVSIDRSADYCRLARWRTQDPGERAKAAGVPKPPPIPDGMEALF